MDIGVSKTEENILNSIYGREVNCVLPEFIKERIRYFRPGLEEYLTLSRCIQYILPDDDNENELAKEYREFNTTSWLPVSDKVKHWKQSDASFLAEQQIAVALIYGLDKENCLVKYGDYYLDNRFVLTSLKQDILFTEEGAERAIKHLNPFKKILKYQKSLKN